MAKMIENPAVAARSSSIHNLLQENDLAVIKTGFWKPLESMPEKVKNIDGGINWPFAGEFKEVKEKRIAAITKLLTEN